MKARILILLKADVGEGEEGWSDSRIIEAVATSAAMIYRVRKQLVEEGFEAVLSRKPGKRLRLNRAIGIVQSDELRELCGFGGKGAKRTTP